MATAAKRGKAAGRAPVGAYTRSSRGTRGAYAQLNALAKGKGAKGARQAGQRAASGGGGA